MQTPTGVSSPLQSTPLSDREVIALEWAKYIPSELTLTRAEHILKVSEEKVSLSSQESDPALYIIRCTVNDLKPIAERDTKRFTPAAFWAAYNKLLDASYISQGYSWVVEFAGLSQAPAIRRADIPLLETSDIPLWMGQTRFLLTRPKIMLENLLDALNNLKIDDPPYVLGKMLDGTFARARRLM